eukprot:TRINITY_DN18806_c0_g1_i4.p1 TRINITY_DN18806_c0_g1~~TRINITY_DN18806_c0_g1_i4.p1  ORF type:complete len:255 (-),score=41.62 TRINITY_DN18806_c0_g1_i4:80-844(-)
MCIRDRQHTATVPLSLRDDFCGTAGLCRAWLRRSPECMATGVDLDTATLQWARVRAQWCDPGMSDRLELLCEDVRQATAKMSGRKHDVIIANNFSYFVFKEQHELAAYFRTVAQGLNPDGLFSLDLYGGEGAMQVQLEDMGQTEFRRLDSGRLMQCTATWEQASYDPKTADTVCHIHWNFPDGSELKRVFTYDWRLWTLPQVLHTLAEAGFGHTAVHFEKHDDEGEMTGEFVEATEPTYSDVCNWFRCQIFARK